MNDPMASPSRPVRPHPRFTVVGLTVALVSLTAMLVLLRPGASAEHIAGATYSGSIDGGGTLQFRVSGDGSGVEHFEVHDVECDGIIVDIEQDFTPPLVIGQDHTFSQMGFGIQRLSFTGSFPSPGTATGTVRYEQSSLPFVQPACDSGTLNWNATTDAPPPTATASPTASPTPVTTASPTASPGEGVQTTWGNANCSGAGHMDPADPVDSLLTLRVDAGLDANTGDCPPLNTEVDVLNASLHIWGDVDCSGEMNPVDSLKILRFDAGLSVAQEDGCPGMGAAITIVET
jgi:hypothetical protein